MSVDHPAQSDVHTGKAKQRGEIMTQERVSLYLHRRIIVLTFVGQSRRLLCLSLSLSLCFQISVLQESCNHKTETLKSGAFIPFSGFGNHITISSLSISVPRL